MTASTARDASTMRRDEEAEMTAWSDSDGYIQVQESGSWDGVPIGNLTWARMLVFEGPIGPCRLCAVGMPGLDRDDIGMGDF